MEVKERGRRGKKEEGRRMKVQNSIKQSLHTVPTCSSSSCTALVDPVDFCAGGGGDIDNRRYK